MRNLLGKNQASLNLDVNSLNVLESRGGDIDYTTPPGRSFLIFFFFANCYVSTTTCPLCLMKTSRQRMRASWPPEQVPNYDADRRPYVSAYYVVKFVAIFPFVDVITAERNDGYWGQKQKSLCARLTRDWILR